MNLFHHNHTHEHHHHHHHHGPQVADASLKNVYILSIVLNLTYVVVEAVAGLYYHSVGLLSDAGHNLSDIISLALALVALGLLHSRGRKGYTYGYRKMSVLISLANAVLLLVAVGAILVESIGKLLHPVEVNGAVVSWTAGIGILVNGITTLLLLRKRSHDLNTQGAFLHMLADTLVSVGVVVSGIVIHFTGWYVIDPIIGLGIALVILAGTWDLLKQSIRLSIDAIPEGVHLDHILAQMQALEGVKEVHHIHIWPISTTETALTAHLVIEDLAASEALVRAAKDILSREGIAHSTLEVETAGHCSDSSVCC